MSEFDTAPDRQTTNALVSYRDSAHETVGTPPLAWVAETARRRTSRRQAATGAAAGLLVAATAVAVATAAGGPSGGPDTQATTSPSPSPSVPPTPTPKSGRPSQTSPSTPATGAPTTPAFDLRNVDWTRATIDLPDQADPACLTGRVRLRGQQATVGDRRFRLVDVKAYGDLDRDGRPDAVLHVFCEQGQYASGDGSGQLLVVRERSGDLLGLGYVGPVGENYGPVRVRGGRLVASVEQRYGGIVQERTYRWDGRQFVQIDGPTAFPG